MSMVQKECILGLDQQDNIVIDIAIYKLKSPYNDCRDFLYFKISIHMTSKVDYCTMNFTLVPSGYLVSWLPTQEPAPRLSDGVT